MSRPLGRVLVFVLALVATLPATAAAESGADIVKAQRARHRVQDEEERQVLTLVSKSGATKERRLVRYVRTGAGDLDKILVRFLAPRDVENTALLTWEARDGNDDQWLYLPSVKKPKRIAASGKKNRFLGTDFAYEDLRPENPAANTYTLTGSESVDGVDCWVVEATPATERQAADSGYARRRLWIRKDNQVTLKREFYDKQNRLEKVEVHRKLVNLAGPIWRANEVEMRDVQAGTRTVITIESRAINRGLTDDFFTETELIR
ncbi:MAG TPA: outer membrane lipoprotein-sorting protein [Methylomirabilota bacterium]|nr:outer membrane lipoprotein-sorting protein [Methylomirabilota bacterium]